MEMPVVTTQKELEAQYLATVNMILTARLMYYIGHTPSMEEYMNLVITKADGSNRIHFTYGTELLMTMDMSAPTEIQVEGWDRITEDEVTGAATGPGPFQLQTWDRLKEFIGPQTIAAVYVDEEDDVPAKPQKPRTAKPKPPVRTRKLLNGPGRQKR